MSETTQTTQDVRHTLVAEFEETICLRDVEEGSHICTLGNLRGRHGTKGRVDTNEVGRRAKLLAAAYNSYSRHCGQNAVREAEADLMGAALDALQLLRGTDKYRCFCGSGDNPNMAGRCTEACKAASAVLRRAGR